MLAACFLAVLSLSACGRIRLASPNGDVSAEVFSYHHDDATGWPGWGMNIKVDNRYFLQVRGLGLNIAHDSETTPECYHLDTAQSRGRYHLAPAVGRAQGGTGALQRDDCGDVGHS